MALVLLGTGAGFFFALALVAELAAGRLGVLLVVGPGGPVRAVAAVVPGVAAGLSSILHKTPFGEHRGGSQLNTATRNVRPWLGSAQEDSSVRVLAAQCCVDRRTKCNGLLLTAQDSLAQRGEDGSDRRELVARPLVAGGGRVDHPLGERRNPYASPNCPVTQRRVGRVQAEVVTAGETAPLPNGSSVDRGPSRGVRLIRARQRPLGMVASLGLPHKPHSDRSPSCGVSGAEAVAWNPALSHSRKGSALAPLGTLSGGANA